MSRPYRPFDYFFKRYFSRGAKRFYERAVGESIVSIRVVEEAELQVKVVFGAADLIVEIITVSGRRVIVHLEFQKAYDAGLGKRMVKYFIAIEEEYGLFPMQIVLCIEDFAEMYSDGAALGNPGEPACVHIVFQAMNLSQLPADWFVNEGEILSVAMGLFCRIDENGEEILLGTYERAIASQTAGLDELGDFVLALQLSLRIKRISQNIFRKFMEATRRYYDIDGLVKDLMYSHPEFYQPLKSELDAKYHSGFKVGFDDGKKVGFDDGIRQTAKNFYRLGLSPEQIFKATGLLPKDYLDS